MMLKLRLNFSLHEKCIRQCNILKLFQFNAEMACYKVASLLDKIISWLDNDIIIIIK